MTLTGGISAALLSLALTTTAARAGDFASFQPIGFSADGSVFAFEEYGVQDGSGFPYSNFFVLDTRKDTFLPGTPIRLRIDKENTSLAEVRAQTAAKAAPLARKFDLAANPGLLAAFNPITETTSDPHRLTYRQYAVDPPVGGDFTLTLNEIPLSPSGPLQGCHAAIGRLSSCLRNRGRKVIGTRCPHRHSRSRQPQMPDGLPYRRCRDV